MQPEAIEAVRNILVEALKILGPATIVAILGYRTAKTQFELRLKELEQRHRFQARFARFQEYRKRQSKTSEDFKELAGVIGELLGQMSGPDDSGLFDQGGLDYLKAWLALLPDALNQLKGEMEECSLKDTTEYSRLLEHVDVVFSIQLTEEPERVRGALVQLMQVAYTMSQCSHLLVQERAERMLQPYLD